MSALGDNERTGIIPPTTGETVTEPEVSDLDKLTDSEGAFLREGNEAAADEKIERFSSTPAEDSTSIQIKSETENQGSVSSERAPKKRRKGSSHLSSKSKSKRKRSKSSGGVTAVISNYWEIEAIEGFRKNKTRKKKVGGEPVIEFLVKWKGFEERSWEPEENLCDTALIDARRVMSEHAASQLGLDEAEDEVAAPQGDTTKEDDLEQQLIDDQVEDEADATETPSDPKSEVQVVGSSEITDDTFEDSNWDWCDQGQIKFHEIERLSVHDPNARRKVAESCQNGIPIVLTGHVGWAQFAKKWLIESSINDNGSDDKEKLTIQATEAEKMDSNTTIDTEQLTSSTNNEEKTDAPTTNDSASESRGIENVTKANNADAKIPPNGTTIDLVGDNPLDLSKTHYIDVEKMIADIGKETVPVIRKKYNEQNPIHAQITVETFLKKCWPTQDEIDKKVPMRRLPWLYLHQWQFPLSDTAVPKLCGEGKCEPIPNHILGDDLLRYWLDKDKINQDSPFQYIFMGREGTKSNLHKDNGNLIITIAPIVGMKEVTLVHRADGPSCLYHLSADIDQADLHRFPLMYCVRAWKSVLKPGEILIMPQGTYHQCQNVSPCLSYHRFYLDTSNLRAFLESYFDQDAPEIQHDEIIWNASHELIDRISTFVEQIEKTGDEKVPYDIEGSVDALRALRNVAREIAIRKADSVEKSAEKSETEDYQWNVMVDDIDFTLHHFRYRLRKLRPPFFPRKVLTEKNNEPHTEKQKKTTRQENIVPSSFQAPDVEEEEAPAQTILEVALRKLPKLSKNEIGTSISDNTKLRTGDRVHLKFHGRRAKATIEKIQDLMQAAYLSYDDFPACHEEYQPIDRLRLRVAGGEKTEVSANSLQPGLHVIHVEQGGEEYRAVVKSVRNATFYLVNLELKKVTDFVQKEWITRDYILDVTEKTAATTPRKKTTSGTSESTPKNLQIATIIEKDTTDAAPTNLDEVLEVTDSPDQHQQQSSSAIEETVGVIADVTTILDRVDEIINAQVGSTNSIAVDAPDAVMSEPGIDTRNGSKNNHEIFETYNERSTIHASNGIPDFLMESDEV